MVAALRRLGARVVNASFSQVVIDSRRTTAAEARAYVNHLVMTLGGQAMFQFLSLEPQMVWQTLVFLGPSDFAGIYRNEDQPDLEQVAPEEVDAQRDARGDVRRPGSGARASQEPSTGRAVPEFSLFNADGEEEDDGFEAPNDAVEMEDGTVIATDEVRRVLRVRRGFTGPLLSHTDRCTGLWSETGCATGFGLGSNGARGRRGG